MQVMGAGNSLRVNVPYQGVFKGIMVSDLSGHRMSRAIPEGSKGWIDFPGLNLANGEYVVSAIGKNGASQKAGKVRISK